jgi:hypothetical protein
VQRARTEVEGIEATIADLQELLRELVGQRKAEVVALIRRLRTVTPPGARAAVTAAEQRLNACLERPEVTVTREPSEGVPAGR